jgi:alpha-tubulin suppressor-like RCC1 family protein/DNA-binding CsgD family transcriptional regulator
MLHLMNRRRRPGADLTPRETEVLALLRNGLSNEQIAEHLGITVSGVKYHVTEILTKLGLENRHDAARWRPEDEKRWWVLAPLFFWRRLGSRWLSPTVAGTLAIGIAAGVGILVWALVATDGGNSDKIAADAGLPFVRAPIAAGSEHTCVVAQTGVLCWGANESGQLGNITIISPNRSAVPVHVTGLPSVIVALSAGGAHTCALGGSGSVWCWGSNASGQLGDGSNQDRATPVLVKSLGKTVAVGSGLDFTCALSSSGEVSCWGGNSYGQLGDGTTAPRRVPQPVSDLDRSVVALAVGGYHACALLRDTTVRCWGRDWEGQLGDNKPSFTNWDDRRTLRTRPVDVISEGGSRLIGVVGLAAGGGFGHTCALMNTGGVECWGSNAWGELGDGVSGDGVPWYRATAAATRNLSGVATISAGGTDSQGGHTCAVTQAGQVYCWGRGYEGQLADGIADEVGLGGSNVPALIVGLSEGAAYVATGGRHTCAIEVAGSVWCWGENSKGQLANDQAAFSNLPLAVPGVVVPAVALTALVPTPPEAPFTSPLDVKPVSTPLPTPKN